MACGSWYDGEAERLDTGELVGPRAMFPEKWKAVGLSIDDVAEYWS